MSNLDTKIEGKNLVEEFIADVVLQALSFVAENGRETAWQRKAEGIRIVKSKVVRFSGASIETLIILRK